MKHTIHLFIILVIAASIVSCKTGKIELRLNPAHHSHYRMLFNTEGKVSVNVAGKDFNTDVHTGIASQIRIDTIGNDKYRFAMEYEDYDISQQVNGKKIDLKQLPPDSSGDLNKVNNFFRGLLFLSVVNKTGKSEETSTPDSLYERLDSNLAGIPEEARKKMMAAIGPLLSNNMAKGMLDQCFYVLPEEKVNIGDSWSNEIVLQNMFSMVMNSEYTLVEVKDSVALLKVHSDIKPGKNDFIMPGLAMAAPKSSEPNPGEGGLDLMGMKMLASFEGTQDGLDWVNMKTGMVQKNTLNQDLKGKVSISILDLPMSMKMVTGYRVEQIM